MATDSSAHVEQGHFPFESSADAADSGRTLESDTRIIASVNCVRR